MSFNNVCLETNRQGHFSRIIGRWCALPDYPWEAENIYRKILILFNEYKVLPSPKRSYKRPGQESLNFLAENTFVSQVYDKFHAIKSK